MSSRNDAAVATTLTTGSIPVAAGLATVLANDINDDSRGEEHFIPVTRHALMDRLSTPEAWPQGMLSDVRRFFRYLDHWRLQQHNADMMRLAQIYEPFSPDSDLFVTRKFTTEECAEILDDVISGVEHLLRQANYVKVDPSVIEDVLTKESHYGLDLSVDFDAFEKMLIYYRGRSVKLEQRRTISRFFRKQEFDVPIFRRVFVLFKTKTFEQRVTEMMTEKRCTRKEAERAIRKIGQALPPTINPGHIYMKMFKNMPRSDIEMIFPNTRVRLRVIDKIKLGVTGGGAVGMGIFGTASKLLAGGLTALNPIALATAAAGLGGVAFRQVMAFFNQRQRYMVIMAQNLYFHAMADNRGVLIKLAERAAEEDIKEEVLLYSVLAKEKVNRRDIAEVDRGVENWLATTFGLQIDFDVTDALDRLLADGIVREEPDGTLVALPPREAALLIDEKWDRFLDELPDYADMPGREVERTHQPAVALTN